MEALNRQVDIDRVHFRLLNLGLVLNVLVPVILLSVGAFLKSKGVGLSSGGNLKILFLVLMVAGVGEIPLIYVMRRSFLSARKAFQEESAGHVATEKVLFQWGVLIFSLSLSPTIYGLVYYLLGGSLERFVLFVAITLFCFLMFKPKLEEISSFVERQADKTDNQKQFSPNSS
jgi:hypothetical protein